MVFSKQNENFKHNNIKKMAIRRYQFNYDFYKAYVEFDVNTDIFTEQSAKEVLDFWTWTYDKENDLIDECIKKYAFECIILSGENNFTLLGIKDAFENKEGWTKIDGSMGIEILTNDCFEFEENNMVMDIKKL